MSICPRHRDAYGIRWRCQKRLCSVPPDWSVHKEKALKGDRGVTIPQSQLLYKLTSVLVPVASRKSIFFITLTWIFVLYLACFCLFIALFLLFPAICKRCRLFLTKESKSTQFEAPSMSTVSTKEIAAIPQAGEQERKGISSPLESAESDPVSVMAEPTSRSFMLLPAPGLRKWLYCSREGNVFSRGKADLVPILLATAPCADKDILLTLCPASCRETLLACAGHKFGLGYCIFLCVCVCVCFLS